MAIWLLMVCGFALGGSYLYFALRLVHIRQSMREQLASLPAEELDCVELSAEDFVRFRVDDHELKIRGRMFDIARLERDGDKIRVYGLYDEAEDNLLAFLNTVILRLHEDENPLPSSLLTLLTQVYMVPQGIVLSQPVSQCGITEVPYLKNFLSVQAKTLTPPPRIS